MRVLMYIFLLLLMLTSCSEDYSRPSQEFITIPDGIFSFVAGNEGTILPCRVNTFQLATTEVSNEQFEAFVNATSYVTRKKKQGGFIFDEGWKLVKEANWRKPEGQAISYEAWKNLPVVQ
ncbi:MAG: SUMF1/EgtB/PvdO family nonheme iron enzyme, partial [Crocinitomicaceae bacterium]